MSAPDHTTVSCRAVTLPLIQPASIPHGPSHVLIIQHRAANPRGGSMAGGETWRKVAPESAKAASGGRYRDRYDRGANTDESGL